MNGMSRMLSSRHWVLTVLHLHSCVKPMTRKRSDEKDTRVVLHLHPALAPFKAAVLPLSKKLGEQAQEVSVSSHKHFMVDYDDAGSIGKRYRRQDEIGTPFCITYDFDCVEDGCVTVRDRDTMAQERVKVDELIHYISKRLKF